MIKVKFPTEMVPIDELLVGDEILVMVDDEHIAKIPIDTIDLNDDSVSNNNCWLSFHANEYGLFQRVLK